MSKQVYQKGDHVLLGEMPPYMKHFPGMTDAIVIGSYADICNGRSDDDKHQFCVFIRGRGQISWYYDSQFTPIARAQYDLLDEWEAELAEDRKNRE